MTAKSQTPSSSAPPSSAPPGTGAPAGSEGGLRRGVLVVAAILLAAFVLAEVNYPNLGPQSQLAVFAMLGLIQCFLSMPMSKRWGASRAAAAVDWLLVVVSVFVCGYVLVSNEPMFERWWGGAQSLGARAGAETQLDYLVGALGVLVVLEATRRAVGLALPILAVAFLAYASLGSHFPDWLFPHRGYDWERIVSQTFLHSQGVFGIALKVMFTYVFLFVLFGALLEATGAIGFVIDGARRLFRNSVGGAAKVSVLSSGLMGSLSGSAVANTATTGAFTIPLMRSGGFKRHVAAGVEAAASSGGALVPPVMGAAAYMMLEIIEPAVTYLEIVRAALIPAILYYLSLFFIVHLTSRRVAAAEGTDEGDAMETDPPAAWAGVVFFGALGVLIALLIMRYTVFRAVTVALVVIVLLSLVSPRTRIGAREVIDALLKTARGAVPLVAAASSVGIVLGVVTLTGIGNKLPAMLLPLAEDSLMLALVIIMACSIVLGMGLPSAVCYLLMATLIGPVLGSLGVPPLAAHMFIFYFGMMSMVTPPVALAAYAAASIAEADIMRAGLAAFRFALVGFTLPFLFVFRPQLLLMGPDGGSVSVLSVVGAVTIAVVGIFALAVGIAGFYGRSLEWIPRLVALAAAALLLFPGVDLELAGVISLSWANVLGAFLFLAFVLVVPRLQPA